MERAGRGELADRILDPMIAIAILVFGLINIWLLSPSELYTFEGSPTAHSLFLLCVCAALTARRRAPVTTAAIVVVGGMTWYYTLGDLTREPPVEHFAALLVASYTIGAWTSGRRFAAGVGALVLIVPAEIPALVAGRPAGDTVPAWIMAAFFVSIGRFVKHHRGMAAQLREQAELLEQEQDAQIRLAAALERNRLARELHDVVTHNLSLMVIQASVERRTRGQDVPVGEHDALRSVEELGRETLDELRRLVGVMRSGGESAALAPQPTLDELPDLVERTREAGLEVDLVVEGPPRRVPAGVSLAAYRIAQEALTNTLRHSHARRAEVVVRYGRAHVDLEILDDGSPPPVREPATGNGLVGMRERAQLYGGSLDAGRSPDGRFRVAASLPTGEGTS